MSEICSAVGAIWHGEYRGGTLEPRRALVMCSGPRCPRAYCSLACYNLWHRNQEMPDIGAAAAARAGGRARDMMLRPAGLAKLITDQNKVTFSLTKYQNRQK